MPPGQGKSGQGVIDRRLRPVSGVVALLAALPEAAVMIVVCPVTGVTTRGSAIVHAVHMAQSAGGAGMPPGQGKRGQGVIDRRLRPVGGVVALLAALPEPTQVFVV